MTSHIFNIQDDGTLIEMNEEPFANEDLFQQLLEQYPNLLAGDQIDAADPRRWLLIRREMGVPEGQHSSHRWSLDHLFLDQDAVPTLVEVKRSSDTRIRREAVGQMLDYAANATAYWSIEKIRAEFEKQCEQDSIASEQRLQAFLEDDRDADEYWTAAKTNLQAGKVRMLFVADEIPTELRRIVEFLNVQMDPAEVLALEIKHFVGTGLKTLVPRIIGQTAEAEAKKKGIPMSKAERMEGLLRVAEKHQVSELYESLIARLQPLIKYCGFTKGNVAFSDRFPETNSTGVVLAIMPGESRPGRGIRVRVNLDRLSQCFGVSRDELLAALPENGQFEQLPDWTNEYHTGNVIDMKSIAPFIDLIAEAKKSQQD